MAIRARPALLMIVVICVTASLLTACGGSSGDSGASPSPATAPSPAATYASGSLPTAAVDALERYFAAVAARDSAAATALLTPSSPLRGDPIMGIAAIRDVTVERRLLGPPPAGVSAMPMVSAWVDGEADSAWGPGSRHDFFMAVTEAPAGVWLIDHMATGP
jgi:hypothetical protein